MALSVSHRFVSTKPEQSDPTIIGPNEWNATHLVTGLPLIFAQDYDFVAQSPGGNLNVGTNVITLAPVPQGVNGSDVDHYLYISGGVGTAESVLITGGSAVAGAVSGTIFVTCANAHSGAWTIDTATAGIHEACQSLATAGTGGLVLVAQGGSVIHAQIHPPYQYTFWIQGTGKSSTVLNIASDFALSHKGVFYFGPSQVNATNADSGGVEKLTILFIQPDSTNLATYTHWPPALYASGNNHVTMDNIIVGLAWDVFTSPLSNGVTVRNTGMSYFHRGISIDQAFDLVMLEQVEAWPFSCTVNQSTVFSAPATNNYMLDLQHGDLIWLSDIIGVSGKFAKLYKSAADGGVPMVFGVDVDMDTNGGFEMSNGMCSLTNINMSTIVGTQPFIVTGGTLILNNVCIFNSGSTSPMILYNANAVNAGAAAALQPGVFITNLSTSASTEDQYIVYALTSGAFTGTAIIQITGGAISRSPGISYVNPLFVQAVGPGTVIMDISRIKIGSNAGVASQAFNFSNDNAHSVFLCDALGTSGWQFVVGPSTRFLDNTGFVNGITGLPQTDRLMNKVLCASSLSATTGVFNTGPNIVAEVAGSANNALVVNLVKSDGVNVPLTSGLIICLVLAHSLQAGANTVVFNGSSAVNIRKHTNPASNLTAAYIVGSFVMLAYDGTQFQDLSQ